MEVLCGIDEAGRGCCAGDLVVAGVVFDQENTIEGLNDSKKISEKKRSVLFEQIVAKTNYHIVVFKPQEIDTLGLSKCMQKALKEIKQHLNATCYLFDGNTNFGIEQIETLIKADGKIPQVSAASILAKVTHDTNILKDASLYPEYGFEKHKGYGTKLHIQKIKEFGYSPIHRRSFKIKALEKTLF